MPDTETTPTPGRTYLTGSTHRPREHRVVSVLSFAALPSGEQATHRTLGRQHGYDPQSHRFVVYETAAGYRGSLTVDTFNATHYESAQAHIAAQA